MAGLNRARNLRKQPGACSGYSSGVATLKLTESQKVTKPAIKIAKVRIDRISVLIDGFRTATE